MTTLLELSRRLWRESGRLGVKPDADVSTAVGDALRVVNAIQDEWRDLQLQPRNWKWMRGTEVNALTTDDGDYSATDFGIESFQSWWRASDDYQPFCYVTTEPGNVWSLEWMPLEAFKRRYLRETVASGRPMHWSVDNDGKLLIGPKPDATGYTLSIDYLKAVTELADDDDEPEMPESFHLLLVWMALESIAIGDEAPHQIARARRNKARMYGQLLDSQADNPTMNDWGPLA